MDGIDIDPDGGNVSAAQLALLEDPTTLFRCGLCQCSMSYLGILEHWQTVHIATPWASQLVQLPLARSVSRLLTALSQIHRLRAKTHSSLRERLESGPIDCACGNDPLREESGNAGVHKHLLLDRLVRPTLFH